MVVVMETCSQSNSKTGFTSDSSDVPIAFDAWS